MEHAPSVWVTIASNVPQVDSAWSAGSYSTTIPQITTAILAQTLISIATLASQHPPSARLASKDTFWSITNAC